jgi:hypothetical protein
MLGADAPTFSRDGWKIEALATYDITARLLHKKRYYAPPTAALVPYDFAVGWGPMSDNSIISQLDISQSNRFFFWEYHEAADRGGPNHLPRGQHASHPVIGRRTALALVGREGGRHSSDRVPRPGHDAGDDSMAQLAFAHGYRQWGVRTDVGGILRIPPAARLISQSSVMPDGDCGWSRGGILLGNGPDEPPRLALHGISSLLEIGGDDVHARANRVHHRVEVMSGVLQIGQGLADAILRKDIIGEPVHVCEGLVEMAIASGEHLDVIEGLLEGAIASGNLHEIIAEMTELDDGFIHV